MGCGGSKVEDLPLVIRCRERKKLIKSAADFRYDLSSSHLAYFHSLKDIGCALSRFVDEQLVIPSPSPSSPVLTLPSDVGKTNKSSLSSGSISHRHPIDDNEGSESDLSLFSNDHVHVHDGYGGGGGSGTKPPSSSVNQPYNEMDLNDPYVINRGPLPNQPSWGPDQANWGDPYVINRGPPVNRSSWGPDQTNWGDPDVINRGPPPYQPSWGPNQASWGDPNPSASPYQPHWGPYEQNFNSYNGYGGNLNSNSNQYVYYMKKSSPASRTVIQPGETRGFQETGQWPDPSHYDPYESRGLYGFSFPQEPKQPSAPKSPPPPPPPKDSDYHNFFDAYDYPYPGYNYEYGSMSSSPDSSEVRKREGIPDLEEETESESHDQEVINGNTFNTKRNSGDDASKPVEKENFEGSSRRIPPGKSEATLSSVPSDDNEAAQSQSVSTEVDKHSPETIVLESMGEGYEGKKGVSFDIDEGSIHDVESSMLSSLTTLSANGSRDLQEVVNEIKDEFEVAFGFGKEVALMLEAGKLPYQSRFAVLKVALSRILNLVAPSMASSDHLMQSVRWGSRITKLAGSYNLDAVPDVKSGNLSSTLEKLYVWEKKLYKEVKDEERLRVIYEEMCKRLNELDACGAESSKIDAAQASVRRLTTKLNVSIKAITSISSEIHKVRDKELRPQVSDLIYGLIRMWQSIVKCHQKQFQAIMESRRRTLRANTTFERESNLKATLELETRLLNWCQHFNNWINAQKSYVKSLNGWLNQCIDHKPELTIDGEVPYSPGRIGAPPIFIICNDWHKEINGVSEERVSKTILNFASNLRRLMEKQDDFAKDFAIKRENGKMVGLENGVDLDTLRRKVGEEWAKHKEGMSSLQSGVIPIFKALENFTCDALKAHEQVRL